MPWILPPELPWAAEALPTGPVVTVLPACVLAAAPAVDYHEALAGTFVPLGREALREARTAEAARVPEVFGWALAGEIGAATGHRWDGRFAVGRATPASCRRLSAALAAGERLDPVLAGFASDQPVLVTWVDGLEAVPISALVLPGEVLHTSSGPVVSDLWAEPYQVTLRVGMALIAPDGTVVVRLSDQIDALLTDDLGAERAGRGVARELAAEVAKLWPCEELVAHR